ncbi:Arylsulfatase [Pontiella desulfatans]|uniref:Arylsulfatase n=1 Tax=Pontiella desulfatans TaxID=2750659 RepID=A0A6C2TVM1_PONDE|nr:sulfatase [Pontiella desulfatans]SPS73606.1 sulfatase S1_8 [Kiritimatiellales bacterium]VGO11705.1 Arylsulfatase [Pontiella desulfatans]
MLKKISVLLLWSAVACVAKPEKPNVVWLVSEDNSASWLKLYNANGASMPNIEKLAANGLVFNHAFSCGVVCSVARSTIISGCYAPRTGAEYHRREKTVPMPEGIRMFPYYLRQAGYHTTNCSKEDYNFNPEEKEGVWDASSKKASYRNRQPGQPFFHVQNYGTTHESSLHFKDMQQANTTDAAAVRLFAYHPDTETFRYTYARYLDNHAKVDAEMGRFIQRLEADGLMDDTFIFYYGDHGGVLPRGKGYAYNNGQQVPMVVHVPKNWRHLVPAKPGSRIDGFVEFVDLSATVLNLAGVDIPAGIDGEPFLGKGVDLDELNARDTAFGYADRFDEKYDLVRTLRKGDFVYMRSYQPFNFDGLHNDYRYKMLAYQEWREMHQAGELNATQARFFEKRPPEILYNVKADPDEVDNLAGNPAYAAKLAEMRGLMQERVKSMPDLSFIPEPVFLREGRGNPTGFGQQNKARIGKLVELADLSLRQFPEVKQGIARALASADPLERYWGLIVCSSFGGQAAPFHDKAKELAASDADPLVRVRAAEFLGLNGEADPRPVIMAALGQAADAVEANLILNSAALLEDSEPGYNFDLSAFGDAPWAKGKKSLAKQRLDYLAK